MTEAITYIFAAAGIVSILMLVVFFVSWGLWALEKWMGQR